VLAPESAFVSTLGISFISIVIEALPFVLLGALVGGVIEVYISPERLSRFFPRRRLPAILTAGLLGIAIPLCECAIIPGTRRLVKKGLPFSAALAYLLAGPIGNPIVAASTAVAYLNDWIVVAARMGGGYIIAVLVALLFARLLPGQKALRPAFVESQDDNDECGCGDDTCVTTNSSQGSGRIVSALRVATEDSLRVGQYLILGAIVAALSQTLLQRQSLLDLGNTEPAAIGVMMTMAVLLNLCSEADAFVAASFRGVLPQAAQLAFMLLGPMLDLKLAGMYLSFVRKRAFLLIATLCSLLVFVAAMLFSWAGI
jgi:hypothetical protein